MREDPAKLLVLRLRGSQAEMGRQHGRILRDRGGHEAAIDYYRDLPARLLFGTRGGGPLVSVLRRLTAPVLDLLLRRLDRDRPAPYRERTLAFMEAIGRDVADARALLVMDLFQNAVGVAGRLGLGPFAGEAAAPACSSLAVWGRASRGGGLGLGRNFDFPGVGIWDRAPVLVFCEPDAGLRYGFVTTRGADVAGVTAFNEAGLVLGSHTRLHREVAFSGLGIVDLVHDLARRAATLDEVVALARERPVASTFGIIVASGRERRAVSLETTAAGVAVVEPAPGEDFLAVTNHYCGPAATRGELAPCAGFGVNTRARARRLREVAARGQAALGLDGPDLARLLGDCVDPEDPAEERAAGSVVSQPTTVQSTVFKPDAEAIHVSVGPCPTGLGPYVRVPWRWTGDVGWEELGAEPEPETGIRAPCSRFASGPAAEAYARMVHAFRVILDDRDFAAARTALEGACALDPAEPRYRFLAGTIALREGDARAALAHLERGLATEGAPFRRGNLLLWAARAAHESGDAARAGEHRAALLATSDPRLASHRRAAEAEAVRPFPARRLRRIAVNFLAADVQ